MFGVSIAELFVVFVVALVVLGPDKLPHVARKLGIFYARSRQWLSKLNAQAEEQLQLVELQERIQEAAKKSDVSDLLQESPQNKKQK
jgi:sec-independent protein translocase protein TatB